MTRGCECSHKFTNDEELYLVQRNPNKPQIMVTETLGLTAPYAHEIYGPQYPLIVSDMMGI